MLNASFSTNTFCKCCRKFFLNQKRNRLMQSKTDKLTQNPATLSLFLVYRHLVRIFADFGLVILLDLIALAACNSQDEIVE